MAFYKYKVNEGGKMVVDYLSSFNLGKEKIKYYKQKDKLFINDQVANLNTILNKDDILILRNDEDKLDLKPLEKKINILYEDDYLLIINKPVNIVVHSDGAKNIDNTLANAVAYYYKNKGYDIPVRYVHRLDKDTTGIIIFAKDPLTEAYLASLIEKRELHRDYLAIVSGKVDKEMVIDKPIGRDRHINGKYRISDTGKEAITILKPIKSLNKYSLVRLSLKTGRTHQIRVHLSSIGHPILGDILYGGNLNLIKRQALHSYYVKFVGIDGKKVEIISKLPYDMNKIVAV